MRYRFGAPATLERGIPEFTPGLRADGVLKRYGETVALAGMALDIPAGTSVALVGESGSGKTTLLRMFNAMVVPDAGRVLVGDVDVASLDPIQLRRHTGYVQQEGGLLPHWTILRNAALVPRLLGRVDREPLARAALDLVGLPADLFGGRWPGELSGGQRQRAAIARAIAAQPRVLLMDEPFGALDAITRAELRRAFARLRAQLDMTLVLVTHDLTEAFELADRVAVLRAGRLEQEGTPNELRETPATPYVRELLETAGVGN